MGWKEHRTRRKPRGGGYGLGGEARKINGEDRTGSVVEESGYISPEERLVWAMLKLAGHDCLMFRRRGYIDEEGNTKILKADLNGFEDDRLAPERVVNFWRNLAQEWLDAIGGKLDARRALNMMLTEPYRGMVNLGGH